MKSKLFVSVLMILGSTSANASALVEKNDETGVVRFISQLNFSGPGLNSENGRQAAEEISRMWNEPHAKVMIGNRVYQSEFVISYTLNRDVPWLEFQSCGENKIVIKNLKSSDDRSSYGLDGSKGTFYTSDDLGHSTTAAHEYGHGLGLNHNEFNQIAAPIPGIMFPRGTLVARRYQYNPNAAPGDTGDTINPIFRHVLAEDIAHINLSQIRFILGYGCVGNGAPLPIAAQNVIPVFKTRNQRLVEGSGYEI